jgi:predicted Zn-dependent protease
LKLFEFFLEYMHSQISCVSTPPRVGTPALDNTRTLSDESAPFNEPMTRHGIVPFGSDPVAISNHLWLETDRRYREAAQALQYVKADQATLSKSSKVSDFTAAPAEVTIVGRATPATRANCSVLFQEITVYFVNSEGSQIQQSWTAAQIAVSVGVKAPDGEGLGRLEQRFGVTPGDLPRDDEIDGMIEAVTGDLDALHDAARRAVSAASSDAAGVFFHEVFGHRIEGHRQKDETSGRTFSSYVGKEIMPEWLSVYDDPTVRTLNGQQLNGFFRFDDEGVRARRTDLVAKGVLEGFLLGRNPIEGFDQSNGHGRKQPGLPPVARQGNLVVSAQRTVERSELEKLLIEEIKRQKRPYGMVFTDIGGGFTNTSAFAQAFQGQPGWPTRSTDSRELVAASTSPARR